MAHMSIPSLPDTFRLYLQFAQAKHAADFWENFEYSSMALSVVMDHIADHIDEPHIQLLAAELGKWEVETSGADPHPQA